MYQRSRLNTTTHEGHLHGNCGKTSMSLELAFPDYNLLIFISQAARFNAETTPPHPLSLVISVNLVTDLHFYHFLGLTDAH